MKNLLTLLVAFAMLPLYSQSVLMEYVYTQPANCSDPGRIFLTITDNFGVVVGDSVWLETVQHGIANTVFHTYPLAWTPDENNSMTVPVSLAGLNVNPGDTLSHLLNLYYWHYDMGNLVYTPTTILVEHLPMQCDILHFCTDNLLTTTGGEANWYDGDGNFLGRDDTLVSPPAGIIIAIPVALETTTYNGFEYAAHTAFPTPWASATSTPTCGQQNIGTVTANIDITGADWYHYIWSTGDTTSTITDLDAGAYSVEISDSDGCLQKSTVLVLDTCGIVTSVSSNEFDQMESRVFPNPSTDQVFIEAKGYEEFSILDAVGHKVSSGRLTSPQMSHDVSNLPVGLYIIELSSNSRPTHILRLVISR